MMRVVISTGTVGPTCTFLLSAYGMSTKKKRRWKLDLHILKPFSTPNEGGVIHGVPHNLMIPSTRTAAAGAA
jgi:hypothetical protein